jgi:hypothetical protein
MSVDLSSIAFALRKNCASAGLEVKLGHAQQMVAAVLSYNSLAAYQASVASGEERQALNGAAHVLLDEELVELRSKDLGLPFGVEALMPVIRKSVAEAFPDARLHRSESSIEDAVRERLEEVVENDSDVISAMTMTNNDGIAEVYLPFEVSLSDIPLPGDVYQVDVEGHVMMELDIERPFSGQKVNVQAYVMLERLGRNVLSKPEYVVTQAGLDYDW